MAWEAESVPSGAAEAAPRSGAEAFPKRPGGFGARARIVIFETCLTVAKQRT